MSKAASLPVNGWLVIDKPTGVSSARIVSIVKKLTKAKKVGHAGTLDPLASGVLPLALGEATKVVSYAMDGVKTYQFTISFGEERDTDDAEGKVTSTNPHIPSQADIEVVFEHFKGEITQTPPAYSALKIGGKRAYALARAGKTVEMQSRIVHVMELSLLSCEGNNATLEVTCGKGTYVRSLARDIARHLGANGYVSMLRRIKVGKFCANHAILLDKLEEMVHTPDRYDFLLPVDTVLDGIPVLVITSDNAERLRNGQAVSLSSMLEGYAPQGVVPVTADGKLVALGKVSGAVIKPVRVFNL